MGSVVEEVVTRVVSIEDISADAALALINLLNLLKENVPALFQVNYTLCVYSLYLQE